jgi:ribonuclease-3
LVQSYTQLCENLSYHFKQTTYLITALTHCSAGSPNNERLEFLGDSLLGFVIAEFLFAQFSSANEGQLTRLRATLVKRKTLMEVAQTIDLGLYLKLGSGEQKNKGWERASVLSNALEALIAAIYLDGGMKSCKKTVLKLWQPYLDKLSLKTVIKDPKTRLQEYLQAKQLPLPTYRILAVQGQSHAQIFEIECIVTDIPPVYAKGNSRRYAEQSAAEKVLDFLNHV